MTRALRAVMAALLLSACAASNGSLDDSMAAYSFGDYGSALSLCKPCGA